MRQQAGSQRAISPWRESLRTCLAPGLVPSQTGRLLRCYKYMRGWYPATLWLWRWLYYTTLRTALHYHCYAADVRGESPSTSGGFEGSRGCGGYGGADGVRWGYGVSVNGGCGGYGGGYGVRWRYGVGVNGLIPAAVPAACPSCHTSSSTLPLNSRSTPPPVHPLPLWPVGPGFFCKHTEQPK